VEALKCEEEIDTDGESGQITSLPDKPVSLSLVSIQIFQKQIDLFKEVNPETICSLILLLILIGST
jgi:hypothetical protein